MTFYIGRKVTGLVLLVVGRTLCHSLLLRKLNCYNQDGIRLVYPHDNQCGVIRTHDLRTNFQLFVSMKIGGTLKFIYLDTCTTLSLLTTRGSELMVGSVRN